MTNLKIIEMKTAELVPYLNNPRKNDNAVDPVAESIKEFGFYEREVERSRASGVSIRHKSRSALRGRSSGPIQKRAISSSIVSADPERP